MGTLAVLFNIVLFRGFFPRLWLKNRTTLIPKSGKDLTQAGNWRPITIAPLLARMYSSLIERRLTQFVTISERQRGFRPGNGCYVNCTILDELIRLGKKSSLVGVQLDVAKAFDTVHHDAIKVALMNQGVPRVLRAAVGDMYRGSSTLLGNTGVEVGIIRGVKQGDPLSPLLFNLVIDPLLVKLENSEHGFRVAESVVSALAYADDISLFSGSVLGMRELLKETSEFLSDAGMRLSVPKCVGYWVMKKGDAWVARNPELSVDGQEIRSCSASTPFDYLGLTYTLARGFTNRQSMLVLERAVERTRRLALKPQQKVQLLMQYLVPTFAHRLTIDPPSSNDLNRVDRTLRVEVKKILHLNMCTADGLLYARKRDGGLGFPRLDIQFKHSTLRIGQELLWSHDRLITDLRAVSNWESRFRSITEQLGIEWPPTPREINSSKRRFKNRAYDEWCSLQSQGTGIEWFRDDPLGNHWLLNQSCLRPGQFIDALKMRTNTYGTRVAINRATRGGVTACRRCHALPETLGHVLGQCVAGQRARIERHNALVTKIEDLAFAKGYEVAREQQFTTNDGQRLKPDLVIKARDSVFVVDVTVRFESGQSLASAALEKQTKYAEIVPTAQRIMAATKGEVIPVVVGSRGAFPKATLTGLRKLGITNTATHIDMSLLALRSSLDIGRMHLDYG